MRAMDSVGSSQMPEETLLVHATRRSQSMERWEEFAGGIARAPRFPLEFPLQYRAGEDAPWLQGRGTNISRSGLLFRTEEQIPVRAAIEVSFLMPAELPEDSRATVICHGRVVRQSPGDLPGEVVVAATIETYRFQRGRQL
jgi:hypothetical protein